MYWRIWKKNKIKQKNLIVKTEYIKMIDFQCLCVSRKAVVYNG